MKKEVRITLYALMSSYCFCTVAQQPAPQMPPPQGAPVAAAPAPMAMAPTAPTTQVVPQTGGPLMAPTPVAVPTPAAPTATVATPATPAPTVTPAPAQPVATAPVAQPAIATMAPAQPVVAAPVPAAPVAAPAPAAPPVAAPAASQAPVAGIRLPLSKEALDKLAVEDKNKSGTILIEGLRKIANSPYNVLELDNKKFANAYEAYMYQIKKILVDEVGNNDLFKLRQQLLDLVGQKDQLGGTLQKFVADTLQFKGSESEFLSNLYKNVDIVLGQLADLFKTCFFYEKTFIDQASLYVEYILANIVASQRTAVQPNDAGKKTSNDLALALMKDFQTAVQGEIDAQSKKNSVNNAAINLSKDYIIWLGDRINRLRVNPGFYRFNTMMPVLDLLACAKDCISLDGKKTKLLLASDGLYKALSEQLFYDPNLLATVLPKTSSVLDVAIADHEKRVAKD